MYQALYRKWRPKTFSDVIGQEHITQTLRRQVAENRLSHAYLFTGTRGTGKTTCAKILAKAANCQHPVNGDPCNQCPSCLGIESGGYLDVLELDAASNNGVDHVRALRDEAIYSPANVRKRVYIVDEVHMLSTAAFNALLKIMEEPPEHLMFILATTELHKVPATILSRCQRFSFKRILPGDIVGRLLHVAKQEQIDLTEDGAELLARMADGALRDALSLLDQCLAVEGTIDSHGVLEVLGLAGNIKTLELMERVLQRNAQGALLLLNELYSSGKDVAAVLGELATLCRDLLIGKTAPQGGEGLLSGGYDRRDLEKLSALADAQRLIFMATQLQATTAGLLNSSNRRTDAELCILRLCDESLCGDPGALSARIARLESALEKGSIQITAAPAAAPKAAAKSGAKPAPAPVEDLPPWDLEEPPISATSVLEQMPAAKPAAKPKAEAAPGPETAAPAPGRDVWGEVQGICKAKLSMSKRVFLNMAQGRMENDALVVYCSSELVANTLQGDEVLSALKEALRQVLGQVIPLRFVAGEAPRQASYAPPPQAAPAPKREAPPVTQAAPQPGASGSGDKLQDLINFGKQFDNFTVK